MALADRVRVAPPCPVGVAGFTESGAEAGVEAFKSWSDVFSRATARFTARLFLSELSLYLRLERMQDSRRQVEQVSSLRLAAVVWAFVGKASGYLFYCKEHIGCVSFLSCK